MVMRSDKGQFVPGERSSLAKFQDDEVVAIRVEVAAGLSLSEAARRYGVTTPAIRAIVLGKSYADVGGPVGRSEASLRASRVRPLKLGTTLADHPNLLAELANDGSLVRRPSDIGVGSRVKLDWRCSRGHTWTAGVAQRVRGAGCPYCSGRRLAREKSLAAVSPGLIEQWHRSKNGALTAWDVAPNSKVVAWWRGGCGHEWDAPVYVLHRGQGCPVCSGKRVIWETSLACLMPGLAMEWHPMKNEALLPEQVSLGSNRRVWWLCNEGHEWQTTVAARALSGTGCGRCVRLGQRSIREIRLAHELASALEVSPAPGEILCASTAWTVDFVARDLRIIVEYDGGSYHSLPGYAERDARKTKDLQDTGWTVIRVRDRPLPKITDADVLCGHSGAIRPVVDQVIASLLRVRPELSDLPGLMAYMQTKGETARADADNEVASMRARQRESRTK